MLAGGTAPSCLGIILHCFESYRLIAMRSLSIRMNGFKKLCSELYDITMPEAPVEALEFYWRHLESDNGPVLEPMCGSGRFLIPFLERGIDIDGADASPHMLQACREHCQRRGLSPVLSQQLLQELALPRQYGFIFIPACSFGLIVDRQAATDSLKRLYEHLLPGGKLVLEVETPRAHTLTPGKWSGHWATRPDGTKIVASVLPTYDPEEQVRRDLYRYELFKDGHLIETELMDSELRFYERDEFQQLLEATGFSDTKATKAYQDTEPDREDAVIVFECRKP